MSENENSAQPGSDFIYTKNSARAGCDFIYSVHKEFGAAEIRFDLHKECRAAEIRFDLHKEFLKKSHEKLMMYSKNFRRCARPFVENVLRKDMC